MKLDEVFVVKSAKHRGYIEQFSHTSINFTQKHLGTICGFFIVRNKDKYNAHVVNFLTSEVKKEFFAVSKRNISEAFEAALHRGNRALTELAKNDNVAWIGSIDGAVCAYDNKNVYFSVTGKGSIFLIRDGDIIDLSEGLASDESATTPMKTFVDTSHGPLCNLDRLIITSNELTDSIGLEELKNNSLRFDNKEFKQLISTILKNESDIASTTIINVIQKIIHEPIHIKKSEQDYEIEDETKQQINVFGADAFISKNPTIPTETEKVISPKGDYTDKRTGHIYVQGDETQTGEQSQLSAMVDKTKDVVNDLSYEAQVHSSKIQHKLIKSSKNTLKIVKKIITSDKVKQALPSAKNFLKEKSKQVSGIVNKSKESLKKSHINQKQEQIEIFNNDIQIKESKTVSNTFNKLNKSENLINKNKNTDRIIENKKFTIKTIITNLNISDYTSKSKKILLPVIRKSFELSKQKAKESTAIIKKTVNKIKPIIKEKIKEKTIISNKEYKCNTNEVKVLSFFKGLSKTTIVITIIFIFILVIIPLLFNQVYSNKTVTITTENIKKPNNNNPTNNEKKKNDINKEKIKQEPKKEMTNITTFSKDMKITDIDNVILITPLLTGKTLITTKNSFIKLDKDDKKTIIKVPREYGNIIHATYMSNLMYVFFITDKNTLYSYSPKVDDFEKQNIKENLNYQKIKSINSYLTYIYILDDDTITRYARIKGGFDSSTKWYAGTSFSGTTSTAIDGDVYVVKNNILSIFSSKKLTNKHLLDNIKVDKIYTNENLKLVWILDTKNKVITGHNKQTLAIEKTISNKDFENITNFSVNEKEKNIIISTSSEIYRIPF